MHALSAALTVMAMLLRGAMGNPAISSETVTLAYERGDHSSAPMDIKVDKEAKTITYHMQDPEGFYADVNTLEDYESGYAVSRVASQDSCFVRQLTEDIDASDNRLHEMRDKGLQRILGRVDVWAEPIDDVQALVGSRLAAFCGESAAYKLVRPDNSLKRSPMIEKDSSSDSLAQYLKNESPDALAQPRSKRQTNVTFFRCFLFFFFPLCFSTTVTINTGTTFIFFLFG
ncbi:hypothetical protein SK128_020155 [Halocaridina rubra]|uniref:BRICHOS domain-containing protein n=1 Tax=Halocaridina rubra TaxID=373956 RepID=A0AAN8X7J3_HALRR